MSDWYDENDEPLGEWVPCSEPEYDAIRFRDDIRWAVFARRGDTIVNQHIYTEWGENGAAHPLISCRDRYNAFGERDHRHAKFVPVVAGGHHA